MRYPEEHKADARYRLLDSGGRHAKCHGFAASGVDALASAAGVTSGSLYKHFDGKSGLFAALIRAELDHAVDRFADIAYGDLEAAEKVGGGLSKSAAHAPPRARVAASRIGRGCRSRRRHCACRFDDGLRAIRRAWNPS